MGNTGRTATVKERAADAGICTDMGMKAKAFTIILFAGTAGCTSNEHESLQAFSRHLSEAKNAAMSNNEQAEIGHWTAAYDVAKEMRWADGMVRARIGQARYYSVRHRYGNVEDTLRDARSMCSNGQCSADSLWSIYDGLMYLYAFDLKDAENAAKIIEAVRADRSRFSDTSEFDEKLRRYEKDLAGIARK